MSISKGLSFDTNVSNFDNFDHHSALVSDPPIVLAQWCVVFHARLPWACSIQVRCCLHGSTRVYTAPLCTCTCLSPPKLLGHTDLDIQLWTDGVLTFSAYQVVKEPPEVCAL